MPVLHRIGGDGVALLLAWVCIIVLVLSIALFLYTPGEGLQTQVVLGAFTMIAVGEVLIRASESKSGITPSHTTME